ncbi:class I SAM-dependent methyltransferase [Achromobacter aegrifaciens]|uniref:class I SAM-dependent methyltransferase n=1 Tax=Achromobacter aegrifaciens TaxID=1287736 RepID=UPI00320B226F
MEENSLKRFISDAQEMLWQSVETRKALEDAGVSIVPSNFYSSTPSLEDLDQTFEQHGAPYLAGFDARVLHRELQELMPYAEGFEVPVEGHENSGEFYWENGQFSYSDAVSYYSYIRKQRPGKVVEIGSGFSSLVALKALHENGSGSLLCIEPYPREFLVDLASKGALDLKRVKAQSVLELNSVLQDGDILFIDSTHTVKIGSDCLHIYLRLLPTIRRKILVHVHDIFLPFGMPVEWAKKLHVYWTEQYLLQAFLLDNPKVKIKFGSYFHERFNFNDLDAFMAGRYQCGGSSFWFEYDGTLGN